MAARFWVGGTGTWDNLSTTHWSATTGGAAGASAPTSADDVTFDAASGGGTVTVNANLSLNNLTTGAFTGTLNFSANNNSVTIAQTFNNNGTGVRTINLGNGTWTMTRNDGQTAWNWNGVTNLTFNANLSTLDFTSNNTSFVTPFQLSQFAVTLTYNKVRLSGVAPYGHSQTGSANIATLEITAQNGLSVGAPVTITNLSVTAGVSIGLFAAASTTLTISNAFSLNGTPAAPLQIGASSLIGDGGTISVPSGTCNFNWAEINSVTFAGGATFRATNSLVRNASKVSGITIVPPLVRQPTLALGI